MAAATGQASCVLREMGLGPLDRCTGRNTVLMGPINQGECEHRNSVTFWINYLIKLTDISLFTDTIILQVSF